MSLLNMMKSNHDKGQYRVSINVAQQLFWGENETLVPDETRKEALRYMIDNYEKFIDQVERECGKDIMFLLLYKDLVKSYHLRVPTPGGGFNPSLDDPEWSLMHMIWLDVITSITKSQKTLFKQWLLDSALKMLAQDFKSKDKFVQFAIWAGMTSE